jgi:DNA-binding FadR family transcriptional regulator
LFPVFIKFEPGNISCLGEIGNQLCYWSRMVMARSTDPVRLLRVYVSKHRFSFNDRLPPERELCVQLDLKRTALRKALAILEGEGQIWRHVGRGTFIGARPVLNLTEVKYLGSISSPSQIVDARLAIEPELASLAAQRATASDLAEIRLCNQRCREAQNWRAFESWDNRLHHALAAGTRNKLLMTLFDTLNAVRRARVWRTVRSGRIPSSSYSSFAEHDAIIAAIANRDPQKASDAMRAHLNSVRARLISGTASLKHSYAAQ